jgi:hypothetical protein
MVAVIAYGFVRHLPHKSNELRLKIAVQHRLDDQSPFSPITKLAVVPTWPLASKSSGITANTAGASSFEARFTRAAS